MSPEFLDKWEQLIDDVDKHSIPLQFIKKVIVKLEGKKQQTINIEKLLEQGLEIEQIEQALSRKLDELDPSITTIEFILNIQKIADTVQPQTDRFLNKL